MENISLFGVGNRSDQELCYYADKALLRDYTKFEKFVKGCEHAARATRRYTAYKARLMEAGFNRCAILGDVNNSQEITLEMHHGPIFNMFDICFIIANAMILRGNIVTTFDIGDLVMTEHEMNNVMVVMLATTPHHSGHNPNSDGIFIDLSATVGRLDRFIERWEDGMAEEHFEYIERYMATREEANGSLDNGLFDVGETLKKFS